MYLIRSLMLAEYRNESGSVQILKSRLNNISREFAIAHLQNFEQAPQAVVDFYDSPSWQLFTPEGKIITSPFSLGSSEFWTLFAHTALRKILGGRHRFNRYGIWEMNSSVMCHQQAEWFKPMF